MTGEFLLLLRPDDHIGRFLSPVDDAVLAAYLDRICAANAITPV